ncbi:MAG: hypothetical protein GC179_11380 [Anaerolineaceae bacterium]|nr:hypothetical protein [Anaerolineaceae bacterium]
MTTLKWSEVYYKPLNLYAYSGTADGLSVGDIKIDFDKPVNFEDRNDEVSIDALMKSAFWLRQISSDSCQPQLAYHVFSATHRPSYLETYFPLVKSLDKDSRHHFHETITKVLLHLGFELQLLKLARVSTQGTWSSSTSTLKSILNYPNDNIFVDCIRVNPAIAYLVAGHIVELFFFRQDFLDRLLQSKIHILLYTDQDSFKADGGVAGGCYNPERGCVQLVVSRLFEGFNQPTPGVFPFLHEFGHMLDFFDAGTAKHELTSSGWLPGMRPSDGEIYSPEARKTFIAGKRLEMQCYDRQVENPDGTDPLPIGHPYVFQSNSEFIAGYLEMFFRNPHYFAAQNPDLFDGFAQLFRQDPRHYWASDFPFYIEQNRAFYHSGQRPRPSGLKLETD